MYETYEFDDPPDETLTHIVCCHPDNALCGYIVKGDNWVDDDEGDDCVACVHVDQACVPCGALFCRLRQWWRDRRSKAVA